MTKAYSYLRFSTPEQMQGDSFRRQFQLAKDYAARHGLELDETLTFHDLGVSAFRGRNARAGALGAFRQAVWDGVVKPGSVLLVESLDRISRQDAWSAMPIFQEIVDGGVTIVTLQDGKSYSTEEMRKNPFKIIESIIVMIRAHEESEIKSRRLAQAWEAKRKDITNKPLTSIAPAWLKQDPKTKRFKILPGRGAVLKRIFADTLAGKGQHAIAKALNAEGVPVFGEGRRAGAFWHRSYIVKLLDNPAVIGTLVPHKLEFRDGKRTRIALDPVPNYYPAVIDAETFDRVQTMRRASVSAARGRHAEAKLENLFGGLALCPECSGRMTLVNKGGKPGKPTYRYLVCVRAKTGAGCKYRTVPYAPIEQAMIVNAPALVGEMPTGIEEERGLQAALEGIAVRSEQIAEESARLLDALAKSGRNSAAVLDRLATMEKERDELNDQKRLIGERLAALSPAGMAKRAAEFLDALERRRGDWRRKANSLARQLFRSVTVNYGEGVLEFDWQQGGRQSMIMYGWPESDA